MMPVILRFFEKKYNKGSLWFAVWGLEKEAQRYEFKIQSKY
jgi:hypothetical protein